MLLGTEPTARLRRLLWVALWLTLAASVLRGIASLA
jgi:hypothetical protein